MDNNHQQNKSWNILNWNIRGLNDENKQRAVRSKIEESSCTIFCIQETKMPHIDCSLIKRIAPKRFNKFAFHPSQGASGGILMGWMDSNFEGEVLLNESFAITVKFKSRHNGQKWKLATIYGPCQGIPRDQFVQWFYDLHLDPEENWLLVGDVNFYRSTEDRNRGGAHYNDMENFNSIISHHGLVEIPLKGKKYTWSNMQASPLLEQLDWCFSSLSLDFSLSKHSPYTSCQDSLGSHSLQSADRHKNT